MFRPLRRERRLSLRFHRLPDPGRSRVCEVWLDCGTVRSVADTQYRPNVHLALNEVVRRPRAPWIVLGYLLGGAFGGYLGSRRGSAKEKYGIVLASIPRSLPEFFIGIVLATIFAGALNWFPTTGMLSLELQRQVAGEALPLWILGTTDFWSHYILPFSTILLYYLTIPTLVMRTSVVETQGQDFLYYHRISGLPKRVRLKQLIKHSSLPVITLFPISMTRAIGGMVLVEVVFNWPGIGNLLVESVLARDFPVIQFVFLLAAIWVILGNYAIDILYSVIDPRITVEGEDG